MAKKKDGMSGSMKSGGSAGIGKKTFGSAANIGKGKHGGKEMAANIK